MASCYEQEAPSRYEYPPAGVRVVAVPYDASLYNCNYRNHPPNHAATVSAAVRQSSLSSVPSEIPRGADPTSTPADVCDDN